MSMICELRAIPEPTAREVMASPEGIHDLLAAGSGPGHRLSLEKSWHGLHFALTGSAWEGDEPLNFLVSGGEPVGDEDVGYGPARVLFADDVARLDNALGLVDEGELRRRFDVAGMQQAEVYPPIWDEPLEGLLEEYGSYFQELKAFVRSAAQRGHALVITLS
jgi:hypothetical protein